MKSSQKVAPRQRVPWILGAFVMVLLTVSFLLQSSNLWKTLSIETASDTLLLYALSSLNFIAFVIFGFIFLRSIIKLVRERRTLQLGAKIKTRLLMYFAAISLLPIMAMAVFSYLFMNRALERWFTQIPENVIREARDVQAQSAADRAARLMDKAKMIASVLDRGELSSDDLNAIAEAGNLARINVSSPANTVLKQGSKPIDQALNVELERILNFAIEGNFKEATLNDGVGFDAAVAQTADGRKIIVVSDFRPETDVARISEASVLEFDRMKGKQVTVRQIGLLTLGVLTFLLIFASTWTAFYIARGLTIPIKALAEGADEIAHGNFSHRVNVFAEDELSLLVNTFNMMSAKLEENSAELSERRKYIETVLQSLPTGVISLEADNTVSTINRAAVNILRLEDGDFRGFRLSQLVNEENNFILERLLSRAKRIGHAAEQTLMKPETSTERSGDSSLPVALIATALPDGNGVVLVIEDLSELIAAQRASAWKEVARRMAHEIKNPLTPIQLSAERIAKRVFADSPETAGTVSTNVSGRGPARPPGSERSTMRDDQTAEVVREGTETILREVNSLKSMVDEFSRFARLPDAELAPGSLNSPVQQAVDMNTGRRNDIKISTELADVLPEVSMDEGHMRRVFVNLIENSLEAFEPGQSTKEIVVRTRYDVARDLVVAEVSDNGKGISPGDFQRLFQPYFSTKGRGTGLGLAIVQRIIAEHHGIIRAANNGDGGAKFTIEIPVI